MVKKDKNLKLLDLELVDFRQWLETCEFGILIQPQNGICLTEFHIDDFIKRNSNKIDSSSLHIYIEDEIADIEDIDEVIVFINDEKVIMSRI